MKKEIALSFRERVYRAHVDFAAVEEIESEVGSFPAFCSRLRDSTWTVGEVVTVCHILLARAGCGCDYMALGEDLVVQGLGRTRVLLLDVLDDLFSPKEGA